MNDRATAFRDFCCDLLGTSPAAPLVLGGAPVNGATLAALLDAFRACHPDAPGATQHAGDGRPHDPLGLRREDA